MLKQHVWGLTYIDELIQTTVDGEDYFALTDSRFNVLALVDDTGVEWSKPPSQPS